jgi:UDP-glucose 4-epimerase
MAGPRKVLITGGCGFIGSNLIAALASGPDAPAVRVLDNESLGKREHIAEFDVDFVNGDIRDADIVRRALNGVDAVVHLAADTRVMDSLENPAYNFDVNVVGSFNLISIMRELGVTRLVNASTGGAIIGEADPPVHEEMVPRPLSPYGASKLAVEGYLSSFSAAYGFNAASLRFSNVFGPRSYHKGSVVAAFFKRILEGKPLVVYGDGEQTRDYVYVGDLTGGIIAALAGIRSGVFQLGSGVPTSINALIDAMREVVGADRIEVRYEPHRAGEVLHTWCDVRKARNELGYDPSTPLVAGLKATWDWFQTNGATPVVRQ